MNVFVYGSLTDPDRVADVVDSFVFVGPAVLEGLHIVEGDYPTLAPGGEAGGRLLRTEEVDALDEYEGVDRGLYVRVSVPRAGTDHTVDPVGPDGAANPAAPDGTGDQRDAPDEVAVYVGDPDALRVDGAVEWPGTGPLAERIRTYVDEAGVRVVPGEIP